MRMLQCEYRLTEDALPESVRGHLSNSAKSSHTSSVKDKENGGEKVMYQLFGEPSLQPIRSKQAIVRFTLKEKRKKFQARINELPYRAGDWLIHWLCRLLSLGVGLAYKPRF